MSFASVGFRKKNRPDLSHRRYGNRPKESYYFVIDSLTDADAPRGPPNPVLPLSLRFNESTSVPIKSVFGWSTRPRELLKVVFNADSVVVIEILEVVLPKISEAVNPPVMSVLIVRTPLRQQRVKVTREDPASGSAKEIPLIMSDELTDDLAELGAVIVGESLTAVTVNHRYCCKLERLPSLTWNKKRRTAVFGLELVSL